MLSYHELSIKMQELKIPSGAPLMVHASMDAFGSVRGGSETVLGTIFSISDRILFPGFTHNTIVIPEDGPENNGIEYGSGTIANSTADFFSPDLPVDTETGQIAEKFREMPSVQRSTHPILSFLGINLDPVLQSQTLADPLAPIQAISDMDGWIVLLGVDHTKNFSIHLAEKQAGRKQFIRWSLTPQGITACPGFPGCSEGFNKIEPVIRDITHQASIENTVLQAIPIHFLVDIAREMITSNPQALLCDRPDCLQCNTIRSEWGT